jgi:hypothetical protein
MEGERWREGHTEGEVKDKRKKREEGDREILTCSWHSISEVEKEKEKELHRNGRVEKAQEEKFGKRERERGKRGIEMFRDHHRLE